MSKSIFIGNLGLQPPPFPPPSPRGSCELDWPNSGVCYDLPIFLEEEF